MGAGGVGDDAGQGGLAGAGRAVEDHAAELVGLDGAAQEPARADDVLLADELVQRARPHARRQRLFLLDQLLAAVVEEAGGGHDCILPWLKGNRKLCSIFWY